MNDTQPMPPVPPGSGPHRGYGLDGPVPGQGLPPQGRGGYPPQGPPPGQGGYPHQGPPPGGDFPPPGQGGYPPQGPPPGGDFPPPGQGGYPPQGPPPGGDFPPPGQGGYPPQGGPSPYDHGPQHEPPPPPRRRREPSDGTGIRRTATIVHSLGDISAAILGLWIVLYMLDANQGNIFVEFIRDAAEWLGAWAQDIFTMDNEGIRVFLNFGLPAIIYLGLGHGIAAKLRSL